jgi:signal transduction histidine kinase
VAVARDDDQIVVAVSNEGRPIPAEQLPRLFERFQRTVAAKAARIQGVGLGLYITRSLVEAHGGRITAASTPEGLTTFRFTLPVGGRGR